MRRRRSRAGWSPAPSACRCSATGVTTLSLTHGSRSPRCRRERQPRRVVDIDLAAAVGQRDAVLHGRRRRDEVQVELALQPLLDDLHVEQAQEADAEAEAQRDRALRLEADRGVVEMELLQRVAQQRVVGSVDAGRCRQRRAAWPACIPAAARSRAGLADVIVSPTWQSRTLLRPGGHVADLARRRAAPPAPAAAGRRPAPGSRSRRPRPSVGPVSCVVQACPRPGGRRRRRPCRGRSASRRSGPAAASSASPLGGGTRATMASSTWSTLVPSLAETRITSSRGMASTFSSSSMTTSGWADGRSILLMTGTITRPWASARWTLASVCASMPCAASTTRIAPSQAWRLRLTS